MSSGQWRCWRALWSRQLQLSLLRATPTQSTFQTIRRKMLWTSLGMMDRRFIEVEEEKRRKYHDVANFMPLIISDQGLMCPALRRQWRY